MAHVSINGVELYISAKSGDRNFDGQGESARALDGTLLTNRTKRKVRIPAVSIPMTQAEADAWRGLLLGNGDTWQFLTAYSGKGLYRSATSGGVAYNGASGKFDKRVTFDAGAYARWTPTGEDALAAGALNPVGDYTLSVWKLTSTGPDVWTHYLVRRLNGATNKWVDGVSNDAATTDFLTVTAGVLQLANGTDAAVFSDMVAVPYGIPSAWPALWYAYARAFPVLPKFEVTGTVLGSPTTPVSFKGLNVRDVPEPLASSATGKRLDFELVEV